jgi:hypothetical protein
LGISIITTQWKLQPFRVVYAHMDKKILINDKTIEQVQKFNYLGRDVSYSYDTDF